MRPDGVPSSYVLTGYRPHTSSRCPCHHADARSFPHILLVLTSSRRHFDAAVLYLSSRLSRCVSLTPPFSTSPPGSHVVLHVLLTPSYILIAPSSSRTIDAVTPTRRAILVTNTRRRHTDSSRHPRHEHSTPSHRLVASSSPHPAYQQREIKTP